jgi:hypothetical protein
VLSLLQKKAGTTTISICTYVTILLVKKKINENTKRTYTSLPPPLFLYLVEERNDTISGDERLETRNY